MNGFDRLREQVKDHDMEQKYLNEEKNIKEMCNFIKEKGKVHAKNGWNFITNEVVFAWAIMYWALPNAFLKINTPKETKNIVTEEKTTKNNVVSINTAKKVLEEKKQVEQLTLFGGVTQ